MDKPGVSFAPSLLETRGRTVKCKSILVADDNQDIRETIVEALLAEGYNAVGARDGRQALQKLDQMPSPTLVLLDLMMPVMSGWEFLDAQKKEVRFAAHQVVTMSAVDSTKTLEKNEPLAVAGNLQKPLSLESLWSKVEEFCELPKDVTGGSDLLDLR
jgi:two-component system response regulator CpxR